MKLLQVDFDFTGPFGEEMATALAELAKSINHEQGVIWKIWTENKQNQIAGGIYLFEDQHSAETYLAMHSARLSAMGITNIRGIIFDVNLPLSQINQAPVTQ